MPSTGQICQESGDYLSDCSHRVEIPLSKGETFPPL